MKNFKNLKVWQDGLLIAELCYKYSSVFPPEEVFGITSQIRRAAYSIPTNVAEGASRETPKAFKQYLRVALGSSFELETFFEISARVYPHLAPPPAELTELLQRVQRMLVGLMKSLDADKRGR